MAGGAGGEILVAAILAEATAVAGGDIPEGTAGAAVAVLRGVRCAIGGGGGGGCWIEGGMGTGVVVVVVVVVVVAVVAVVVVVVAVAVVVVVVVVDVLVLAVGFGGLAGSFVSCWGHDGQWTTL